LSKTANRYREIVKKPKLLHRVMTMFTSRQNPYNFAPI